jgi:membrane-bound metal-dependent hydrolase YbcI (DUF457 family)
MSFKALMLAAFAANIPDLDLLVSLWLYSDHKLLHGGITHSFAFAAMLAVLVWLVTQARHLPVIIAVVSFLLVASHVIVDWLTGPYWGLHPSHGLAPFWPVSDTLMRMPLTLFQGVNHSSLLPDALYTALWEMVLLGPVVILFIITTIKTLKPNYY